jgi:hypothetical protein
MALKTILTVIVAFSYVASVRATEICEVKHKAPSQFGEHVLVTGEILSDGVHRTVVLPDACKGTGFALVSNNNDDQEMHIIRQAIMQVGAPGTIDKQIHVELEATIVKLGDDRVGLGIDKLKRLVLIYPSPMGGR